MAKRLRLSSIPALQSQDVSESLLQEDTIGINEVCLMLHASRVRVMKAIHEEGLPHDKFGNRYIFYKSLVLEWRLKRQRKIIPIRGDVKID